MKRAVSFITLQIVCLGVFFLSADSTRAVSGYTFGQWGQEILTQIESDFGRSDCLYKHSITDTFPDYAWGQGVALNALVAAAKTDSFWLGRARKNADEFHLRYWCTQDGTSGYNASYGNCGDRYYDDNAWIALALLELYKLTEIEKYLDWAQATITFSMSGENGPGDTPDGGIRWHESSTGGASICATAPTCLANLIAYQVTGIESYKTDGLRLYNWLITTTDYRYSNGIFHEMNEGPLGYQTAVVTQAAVRLYQITGESVYLAEAQLMAAAMEHEFITKDTHVLNQTGKWGGHDMTNAYVELYEADHNPHWLNIAAGYLEYLHDYCKDPTTGRYPESWNNTSGTPSGGLIDNASVARACRKMAGTPGGTGPQYVLIQNRASAKCLRLYNSQTIDNTQLVIYDQQPSYTSEMFTLVDMGNGYYNLRSWMADKSLQPYNNGTADNTNAVIYSANAVLSSQQWSLIDLGNSYFNIKNRLTGKSLQPKNSGTTSNTPVVMNTTNTSLESQQWRFVGVNIPTSMTPSLSVNGGNWQQTDRVIAEIGDTVSLKVQAPGTGTWRWEGPAGFTAAGNQVTLQDIQFAETGAYIVTYTNPNGVESYTDFRITISRAVRLYQHCPYDGWQADFGPGAYTAADIIAAGGLNNDASSARIAPGYTVTFFDYDNFQGASMVKTSDDTCFVDDGWNDRITSMIVEGGPEPAAYWQFNDNGGTVLGDVSGGGNNGQLMNMDQANWTAGKHCGGLFFDGTDDYVEITGFKGINGTGNRTCTAWVKTTNTEFCTIMSWGTEQNGRKWMLNLRDAGAFSVAVWAGYVASVNTVNDGQWHHVAAVLYDDVTPDISEILLYVDGILQETYVSSAQAIATVADQDVKIGVFEKNDVLSNPFEGLIDESRIYNHALGDSQIRAIYEEYVLIGDAEPDGDIDLNDFAAFADFWQNTQTCEGDLTCDCRVDIDDFLVLADQWLDRVN